MYLHLFIKFIIDMKETYQVSVICEIKMDSVIYFAMISSTGKNTY